MAEHICRWPRGVVLERGSSHKHEGRQVFLPPFYFGETRRLRAYLPGDLISPRCCLMPAALAIASKRAMTHALLLPDMSPTSDIASVFFVTLSPDACASIARFRSATSPSASRPVSRNATAPVS